MPAGEKWSAGLLAEIGSMASPGAITVIAEQAGNWNRHRAVLFARDRVGIGDQVGNNGLQGEDEGIANGSNIRGVLVGADGKRGVIGARRTGAQEGRIQIKRAILIQQLLVERGHAETAGVGTGDYR